MSDAPLTDGELRQALDHAQAAAAAMERVLHFTRERIGVHAACRAAALVRDLEAARALKP